MIKKFDILILLVWFVVFDEYHTQEYKRIISYRDYEEQEYIKIYDQYAEEEIEELEEFSYDKMTNNEDNIRLTNKVILNIPSTYYPKNSVHSNPNEDQYMHHQKEQNPKNELKSIDKGSGIEKKSKSKGYKYGQSSKSPKPQYGNSQQGDYPKSKNYQTQQKKTKSPTSQKKIPTQQPHQYNDYAPPYPNTQVYRNAQVNTQELEHTAPLQVENISERKLAREVTSPREMAHNENQGYQSIANTPTSPPKPNETLAEAIPKANKFQTSTKVENTRNQELRNTPLNNEIPNTNNKANSNSEPLTNPKSNDKDEVIKAPDEKKGVKGSDREEDEVRDQEEIEASDQEESMATEPQKTTNHNQPLKPTNIELANTMQSPKENLDRNDNSALLDNTSHYKNEPSISFIDEFKKTLTMLYHEIPKHSENIHHMIEYLFISYIIPLYKDFRQKPWFNTLIFTLGIIYVLHKLSTFMKSLLSKSKKPKAIQKSSKEFIDTCELDNKLTNLSKQIKDLRSIIEKKKSSSTTTQISHTKNLFFIKDKNIILDISKLILENDNHLNNLVKDLGFYNQTIITFEKNLIESHKEMSKTLKAHNNTHKAALINCSLIYLMSFFLSNLQKKIQARKHNYASHKDESDSGFKSVPQDEINMSFKSSGVSLNLDDSKEGNFLTNSFANNTEIDNKTDEKIIFKIDSPVKKVQFFKKDPMQISTTVAEPEHINFKKTKKSSPYTGLNARKSRILPIYQYNTGVKSVTDVNEPYFHNKIWLNESANKQSPNANIGLENLDEKDISQQLKPHNPPAIYTFSPKPARVVSANNDEALFNYLDPHYNRFEPAKPKDKEISSINILPDDSANEFTTPVTLAQVFKPLPSTHPSSAIKALSPFAIKHRPLASVRRIGANMGLPKSGGKLNQGSLFPINASDEVTSTMSQIKKLSEV